MNRNRNHPGVFSVIGLIVVLGITGGLDAFIAFLHHRNRELSSLFYAFFFFWSQTLIALLLAAILLFLSWFVLYRARRSIWVAVLYLLTGLYIVLTPEIYFTPALSDWMPQWIFNTVVLPDSHMYVAGGFIAILGLFSLILPGPERMVSQG